MSIVFHCQVPRTDWTFIHTYIYIYIDMSRIVSGKDFCSIQLWSFVGDMFEKIISYLDRYRSHSLFFLPDLKHMSSLLHLLFPVYILSLKLTAKTPEKWWNWKLSLWSFFASWQVIVVSFRGCAPELFGSPWPRAKRWRALLVTSGSAWFWNPRFAAKKCHWFSLITLFPFANRDYQKRASSHKINQP